MKKNVFYVLRLALILLVITGCVAAVLAGINVITADKIAAIQEEKTNNAIRQVLEGTPQKLMLSDDTGIVRSAYKSDLGYAVEVAPTGFGGQIVMMVGVDFEGKVTGIAVISQTETAGLGADAAADNAKGKDFRDQFVGVGAGEAVMEKDGGALDALTGATISSRAVAAGVEAAIEFVQKEAA